MELISTLGTNLGSGLITLLAFLFALTVVVFVHEFGHFQVARWCGVAVKTFSIGFGREIYGWNDAHGTHWRIAAIPLGGFVQFVDDANAASAGKEDGDGNEQEQLTDEQRAGAFHTKPVWKRSAVVAAGPIYNFILAIVIFAITFMVLGAKTIEPKVAQVTPDTPAAAAGFLPMDVIKSINGSKIYGFKDLQKTVSRRVGQELTFGVLRDGAQISIKATPELREFDNALAGKKVRHPVIGIAIDYAPKVATVTPDSIAANAGFKSGDVILAIGERRIESFSDVRAQITGNPDRELSFLIMRGKKKLTLTAVPQLAPTSDTGSNSPDLVAQIGIKPSPLTATVTHRSVGPISAVAMGAQETWDIVTGTLIYVRDIFTAKQGAEQIGGIVQIADVAGKVATHDWRRLIVFTAFISVSIGLINLFPIPILDGGHLVFYAIEAVRGRPLSEQVQEYCFRVGLVLILMLMLFGFWNDRGILLRWLSLTG